MTAVVRNRIITLLESDARTETVASADMRNARHRGARIHIDVTAKAATPSLTVTVQGKDEVTGDYYTLLAGTALTDVGDQYLLIYPGIGDRAYDDDAAIAGRLDAPLPPYWRVNCVHGDADEITYSVTAELLI